MSGRRGAAVFAFLLLCGFCDAIEDEVCDARTGECLHKDQMFAMMKVMREQLAQHERELANASCTICNIKLPCLNGGIRIPLSVNNYECKCPEDTSGFNCEKKIKCSANLCGANAKCYVRHHKVNCVCDKEFGGNPFWGCKQHYKQSCASGDPHFNTFDGAYYDYQSTCPYVFSEPCTSFEGYSFYSVKARNRAYNDASHVSYISEVEVMMHNRTIHIDEKMNLFVDGISTFYPLYYPSRDNAMVTVKRVFDQATIKNDDGVQVTFYVGYLCVRVPDVSEFRRKRTLCGLAGNMDGICRDDFIHRKGNEVDPGEGGFFDSCRFNGNRDASLNIAKAEDTWRTEEFLNYATTDACVDGWTMANITKHCNIATMSEKCQPTKEALAGKGPFGACQNLGKDLIDAAYENC